MSKTLKCGDVVPGCPAQFRGNSEEDILRQAAVHARNIHNMNDIPPEVLEKVKGAIHDDGR